MNPEPLERKTEVVLSLSPTPFDTKNKMPNHLQVILLDSKDKS